MKEELEYFTNQCYKEVKRSALVDYEIGRETTINMGEMMLRFIFEVTTTTNQYSLVK